MITIIPIRIHIHVHIHIHATRICTRIHTFSGPVPITAALLMGPIGEGAIPVHAATRSAISLLLLLVVVVVIVVYTIILYNNSNHNIIIAIPVHAAKRSARCIDASLQRFQGYGFHLSTHYFVILR